MCDEKEMSSPVKLREWTSLVHCAGLEKSGLESAVSFGLLGKIDKIQTCTMKPCLRFVKLGYDNYKMVKRRNLS